ncbi:MAG TPA: cupin domain-containing protein [Pyrinomonadaceae bacterium]|nr:cupin domain-containing protein [Pyrinomonadaceae bacterium]
MKHTDRGDEIVEQVSLYALGALQEDEASAFEAHLETGCALCAAEVEPSRLVVTALGMAAPELDPPTAVRDKLLERLARTDTSPLSFALDSFVTVRAHEGEWRQIFEGVSVKRLFADQQRGTVTSLFKVRPGGSFPPHTHEGFEQCLIIEGDFHLNDETYGPGDFTCAMAGSVHNVSYSERGALLLIVASTGYSMSDQPVA